MNLDQWMDEVQEGFKSSGKAFSLEIRELLLSVNTEEPTDYQKQLRAQVLEVILRLFFQKAVRGQSFADVDRIRQRFGMTLEQNYSVGPGPFLDLAKAYWTFKIESQDLAPLHSNLTIAQSLFAIEFDLGSKFFPTSGALGVPDTLRKMSQKDLLQRFAPGFDIERYFIENPFFHADSSRRGAGCMTVLSLCSLPAAIVFLLLRSVLQ